MAYTIKTIFKNIILKQFVSKQMYRNKMSWNILKWMFHISIINSLYLPILLFDGKISKKLGNGGIL